jgi:hypothetical protein
MASPVAGLLAFAQLQTFELSAAAQTRLGVQALPGADVDTTDLEKLTLMLSPTLDEIYGQNSFLGRYQVDYVAVGASGPDLLATGRTVTYFDALDLFATPDQARTVAQAAERELIDKGYRSLPVPNSTESEYQQLPAGSNVLDTIAYVQDGPLVVKIDGSCRGCRPGSTPPDFEAFVEAQVSAVVLPH